MEEVLDLKIDEETLKNNFSKKEIEIIKQLQKSGQGEGKGPQMTPQDRNCLMEKLFNVNNLSTQKKDPKDMTKEELEQYRKENRERLRNKIKFKTNSRNPRNNMGTLLNNKNKSSNPNDPVPIDVSSIDGIKDVVQKMTGSNDNPDIQKKLEDLFSDESIGNLMKDDSMKDKMGELLKQKGFCDLFNDYTNKTSQSSNKNKKKKRNKKKKKPNNLNKINQEITENIKVDESFWCCKNEPQEELLEDFVCEKSQV